jgi:hypothetical protein
VILLLAGANLVLWFSNRTFGYTVKDHGAAFLFVYAVDFFALLGFALLGLLTAWLLAFRPETFKRAIERSIAKRERAIAKRNPN